MFCRRTKETSCISNTKGGTAKERNATIQYLINIATSSSLCSGHHGDAQLLDDAVSYSHKVAMGVLRKIEVGKEEPLFTNKRCLDSILASDRPAKLEEFVLSPQKSRAVPGKEKVLIRYRKYHIKFILLKTKYNIIDEFKLTYFECKFNVSTLMREFPP